MMTDAAGRRPSARFLGVVVPPRFLGVVVPPIYLVEEGVDQVLDALESVGATAVCLTPTSATVVVDGGGARFPDLHVDGLQRVLERRIAGRDELCVTSQPAYAPDVALYEAGLYSPPREQRSAAAGRSAVAEAIDAAHARGLAAHLQLNPLMPPGLRTEDLPVAIDGSPPPAPQVARLGCINNPDVKAYALALVADTLQAFETIDGLVIDWAEFPAYRLDELTTCFCRHCARAARSAGIDWQTVQWDVGAIWDRLHALRPEDLGRARRALGSPTALVELMSRHRGMLDFVRFKAISVEAFFESVAAVMRSSRRTPVELTARGWAPPWNRASGFDVGRLAGVCDAVAPKLFSFDYAAIPRWYGEPLLEWNPALPERELARTLLACMDLVETPSRAVLADFQIPRPDEQHPVNGAAYGRRISEVLDQVGGRSACLPIAHAYGPLHQWEETLQALVHSGADGIWVQMYGYLGDEKLRALAETWG